MGGNGFRRVGLFLLVPLRRIWGDFHLILNQESGHSFLFLFLSSFIGLFLFAFPTSLIRHETRPAICETRLYNIRKNRVTPRIVDVEM